MRTRRSLARTLPEPSTSARSRGDARDERGVGGAMGEQVNGRASTHVRLKSAMPVGRLNPDLLATYAAHVCAHSHTRTLAHALYTLAHTGTGTIAARANDRAAAATATSARPK